MKPSRVIAWIGCWAALVLLGGYLGGIAGFAAALATFTLGTSAVLGWRERRGK